MPNLFKIGNRCIVKIFQFRIFVYLSLHLSENYYTNNGCNNSEHHQQTIDVCFVIHILIFIKDLDKVFQFIFIRLLIHNITNIVG